MDNSYEIDIHPKCLEEIRKKSKKNPLLQETLQKKMEEIVQNPYHYKPLRYDLAGERRVHILKHFVLKFTVDEQKKIVTFLFFGHHDEAYQR